MKQKRETRVFAAPQRFEVRKNKDGSQTIGGQAVIYGAESQMLGDGFIERIAPGAFAASLRTEDQLCPFGHDESRILGRKSSGTLTLTDSSTALSFRCILPNTPDGQTVAELCRRGDLRGMSFGMVVNDDRWEVDSSGRVVRTVLEAALIEISPVSMPAYTQSTVSLRSCPAAIREKMGVTQRDDDDDGGDCDPEIDADCDQFDADDDDDSDRSAVACQCPTTDEQRADALRIRQLFAARQRLNTQTQ